MTKSVTTRAARRRTTRWPVVAGAVLLVALPARGDVSMLLTPPVQSELTLIDAPPSVSSLNTAFTTPDLAQSSLGLIALDPTVDAGVRIRAIRTLAGYCPQTGCTEGPVHQTLNQLVVAYQLLAAPTGKDVMLLRAAVETMGVAQVVLAGDIPPLKSLLAHPSRDVRATVVRALRTTCDAQVLAALVSLHITEPTAQVRGELVAAEQLLDACIPK
ncbi:MAG TPA: HEAT repeat domain-containing protein [Kofleriaceae bacterium]|nr:HEAT repeat domain-containing protein [Kofleriaceae bacterium]